MAYGKGLWKFQGGTWQEVKNFTVKTRNGDVPIKKGYTKVDGVWKQFYPSTGSVSFSSVGSNTFVVPPGIFKLNVLASGAGGGGGGYDAGHPGSAGRSGTQITGTISVNPGDIITISVGGAGTPGGSGSGYGAGVGGYSSVGYDGGHGGEPGSAGWSGGGGGGGAATVILVNGVVAAVAAGGGGGGGGGWHSDGDGGNQSTEYYGGGGSGDTNG
jgi:hypothetical protein